MEWRSDRIGAALDGTNPTVLRRLPAGFAVIGDVQFLPGYCVFLTDTVGAGRLTDLSRAARASFLAGMDLLGEAVEIVCARRDPDFIRVNLEILGNADDFLHAHVWPRYAWEPASMVRKPVWLYPASSWTSEEHALSGAHDELRADIAAEIERLAARGGH